LVNETPQSEAAAPARTRWQRHVIDPIAAQLTQGITPEKVALTWPSAAPWRFSRSSAPPLSFAWWRASS